jgi:hypothetical protein
MCSVGLQEQLKWQSACLTGVRPQIQSPIQPKNFLKVFLSPDVLYNLLFAFWEYQSNPQTFFFHGNIMN